MIKLVKCDDGHSIVGMIHIVEISLMYLMQLYYLNTGGPNPIE